MRKRVVIQAIFGPQFQTLAGDWLRFESPEAVHSTCEVSPVKCVIRSAEAAARANNWVAIMLSYEAAPAFDSAFKVYPSHDFPLVWAAVFPSPCRKDAGEKGESQKISDWQPAITQAQYARGVDEIRSRIAEGDTYQVN